MRRHRERLAGVLHLGKAPPPGVLFHKLETRLRPAEEVLYEVLIGLLGELDCLRGLSRYRPTFTASSLPARRRSSTITNIKGPETHQAAVPRRSTRA